jgi:hypothetical protein
MASTYTLISSNVLSSSAASVTFSSIPSTYTDLVLRVSGRTTVTGQAMDVMTLQFNGLGGTSYSITRLTGNGSAAASSRNSGVDVINAYYILDAADATANTFGSVEVYIPSYTIAQNKPVSVIGSQENNLAAAYTAATAGLWQNTSAITQIAITSTGGGNLVSGSSFYLYGIKNS